MSEDNKNRDILDTNSDVSSGMMADHEAFPVDNMPKTDVERPVYNQTQNSYFLNKFLDKKVAENKTDSDVDGKIGDQSTDQAGEHDNNVSTEDLQANVIEALKEIYDPEIPVNIYELGLIYGVNVADDKSVLVTMTLTTPHCPVAESMPGEVELRVNAVKGTNGAEVRLVWEPPWDMARMSDEARLELGLL
jgi:FeS assembly SUF system protein